MTDFTTLKIFQRTKLNLTNAFQSQEPATITYSNKGGPLALYARNADTANTGSVQGICIFALNASTSIR